MGGGLSRSSLEKGRVWGPQSALGCWTLGFGQEQYLWGLCAAIPGPTHLAAEGGVGGGSLRCADAPLALAPGAGLPGGSPQAFAGCLLAPLALSPVSTTPPLSFSIRIISLGLSSLCISLSPVLSALRCLCGQWVFLPVTLALSRICLNL